MASEAKTERTIQANNDNRASLSSQFRSSSGVDESTMKNGLLCVWARGAPGVSVKNPYLTQPCTPDFFVGKNQPLKPNSTCGWLNSLSICFNHPL